MSLNLDGQSRSDEEIEIDDGSFVGATLTHCVLVYRGGGFPNFKDAHIIEPQWTFRDAASRAVGMLAIIGLEWPNLADELVAMARRQITKRVSN